MNRRKFLAIAPAATVLPAAAQASDSGIMDLFAEYRWRFIKYETMPVTTPEEVSEALWSEMSALEDAMMAIPARTAQDMAAKMIVGHCFGTLTCNDYETSPEWIEARALVDG